MAAWGLNFRRTGYAAPVDRELSSRGDLIRLAATTEVLLALAERVDGEIADEAIVAELHELRDRAQSAIRSFSEQR